MALTHCNRFATGSELARCHGPGFQHTLCVLHNLSEKHDEGRKKNYLSILERFMPSGESGLNGLGCRINLTDSLICA